MRYRLKTNKQKPRKRMSERVGVIEIQAPDNKRERERERKKGREGA